MAKMARRKGYAEGGSVPSMSPDDLKQAYAAGSARWGKLTPQQRAQEIEVLHPADGPWLDRMGQAKGGPIKRTAGPPIGKDTGMIPAQRGEFVVRKSAAQQYGPSKLQAVNQGRAKISSGSGSNSTKSLAAEVTRRVAARSK